MDRIERFDELDEPSAPPHQVRLTDISDGVFAAHTELPLVTLRVGRWARWITEYYPCERIVEESSDRWLVSLRASDLAWARRLVLSLGPEVTVLDPPELVEDVRYEASRALAAYLPG
jgi:proteasome accessory factor C